METYRESEVEVKEFLFCSVKDSYVSYHFIYSIVVMGFWASTI